MGVYGKTYSTVSVFNNSIGYNEYGFVVILIKGVCGETANQIKKIFL